MLCFVPQPAGLTISISVEAVVLVLLSELYLLRNRIIKCFITEISAAGVISEG